jgi:hypothetical protein
MKRIVIAAAMSLCVVSLAATASADTLIMRDGTRVEGTLVGIAGRTITFRHADGAARRYFTSEVESLEFVSAERANPRFVSGRSLETPAGTELVVRTVETIDSQTSGPDQIFSAIVEHDVRNDSGGVVIPGGSSAQLMIRQMSTAGGLEIVLDIHAITIDGRRYLVSTVDVTQGSGTGVGRNRRTAETVGTGATVGTIIGGGGVHVLTRGRQVQVPAETVLEFRLDKLATLHAAQ